MQVDFSVDEDEDVGFENLNLMIISDLRDMVCLFEGEEAGQRGCSLSGAEIGLFVEEGVSEGTQKEGKVVFADCI